METERAIEDVSALLRHRRTKILGRWEVSARALGPAAELSRERLLAQMPSLLPAIAASLQRPEDDATRERLNRVAEQHAVARMQQGFDLPNATEELTMLRACIHRAWEDEVSPPARARFAQDRELEVVLDRVLLAVVRKYAEVQTRALRALDRVASISLESSSLEELLHRFASALVEELPSVDCASIHLFEDGTTEIRASVGSEANRTLYEVPFVWGDERIGVARVGSENAEALSCQDRLLFDSMISRATATIHQQMYREAAERRAQQLAMSERRLRRTDARMRLALEVAELEPWDWDFSMGEVTCSNRGRAMLGVAPDHPVTMKTLLKLVPPDERAAHAAAWRSAVESRSDVLVTRDHRIVRPSDGRARWLAVRARLRFDDGGCVLGVFGTVMDVTDQKRAEERARLLAEATEQLSSSLDYRETLHHIAEAMVPRIADGCAVDVVRPDGTLGDYVAIAGDPSKVRAVRELRCRALPRPDAPRGIMKVIRTGEPELVDLVDRSFLADSSQDARQLDVIEGLGVEALLIVPIGGPGRTLGALTLAHTTPGRRFCPDDVELATQIADRAATAIVNARLHEQTTHAAELRERLLSVISHDLRTPLTAIELASALLSESLRDHPTAHAHAQIVRRNAARIGKLVNDLVDLSHLQEGRLTLELRSCLLRPLIDRVTGSMRERADEAGVELRVRTTLGDAMVRCDRARLRDALTRIVDYAIERAGEEDTVTLEAERSSDRVLITLTGPGIGDEAEDLDRLFELYWRGTMAAERARGLGLFIARGVIEAHGGRMWVQSGPDGQPLFVVSLRLDDTSD